LEDGKKEEGKGKRGQGKKKREKRRKERKRREGGKRGFLTASTSRSIFSASAYFPWREREYATTRSASSL
jgi:hypothetical protein